MTQKKCSSDEDTDEPEVPQQPAQPPRQRTRRNNMDEPKMPDITLDPINQTLRSRSTTSTTEDIHHYFSRGQGQDMVCKPCMEEYNKDPTTWDVKYGKPGHGSHCQCNFYYSLKTATGPLRKHLEIWHILDYVIQACTQSWVPQISIISNAINQGYSLESLETFLQEGIDIKALPPLLAVDANANAVDLTGQGTIPRYVAMLQDILKY
ncbi:hypothetical protein JVT61DRAFT_14656 [Boletus reticuloceps]|uniref:Uncharacterized protein n=1 Tax=Boletus reticuloceps TaxID=495285 RepID=A0A8I3AAC9_9AGAM|nr:hypothetical protein JVT61DRAFT_14656 [Boletus reticuloceps]